VRDSVGGGSPPPLTDDKSSPQTQAIRTTMRTECMKVRVARAASHLLQAGWRVSARPEPQRGSSRCPAGRPTAPSRQSANREGPPPARRDHRYGTNAGASTAFALSTVIATMQVPRPLGFPNAWPGPGIRCEQGCAELGPLFADRSDLRRRGDRRRTT